MPDIDKETNATGNPLWPKWVTNKEGKQVVVNNKKEEAEALGNNEEEKKPVAKPKATEANKAGWTE